MSMQSVSDSEKMIALRHILYNILGLKALGQTNDTQSNRG